jgi:UDP-N-acetylglucosamine enolpyruvyl transferase
MVLYLITKQIVIEISNSVPVISSIIFKNSALTLSLTGGGSLFERPVLKKLQSLKKRFGKISYSAEMISALKLSSGVAS